MTVNNVKSQGSPIAPATSQGASEAAKSSGAQLKTAAGAYAKAGPGAGVKEAANVQISNKAREMNLAKKVAEATPDVREDKVAMFKSMIERGEYKPDPGKIADGVMAEAIKDELSKNPDAVLE